MVVFRRELFPAGGLTIPANTSLSTIRQDAELQETIGKYFPVIRFVLAACAWLHQRIVTVSSGHIERHRRKQITREHDVQLPSDVKVIQLRRTESSSREPSGSGDPVEWSCRWLVNGHWRNQSYKDEHKLIYIMPYVKGPEDKPLKVPAHTVYSVSR